MDANVAHGAHPAGQSSRPAVTRQRGHSGNRRLTAALRSTARAIGGIANTTPARTCAAVTTSTTLVIHLKQARWSTTGGVALVPATVPGSVSSRSGSDVRS